MEVHGLQGYGLRWRLIRFAALSTSLESVDLQVFVLLLTQLIGHFVVLVRPRWIGRPRPAGRGQDQTTAGDCPFNSVECQTSHRQLKKTCKLLFLAYPTDCLPD